MHRVPPETIYALASFVCASVGAVCDVRTRRIPNWLSGSGVLAGLALHLAVGGWRSLAAAAAGGALAGAAFLLFYLAGGMGAGDVKLIAAIGCLAGLGSIAGILIATALLGGLLALVLALVHHQLKTTFVNLGRLLLHHGSAGLRPHSELNLTNPGTLRLPYAVAMAAGAGSSLCAVLLR